MISYQRLLWSHFPLCKQQEYLKFLNCDRFRNVFYREISRVQEEWKVYTIHGKVPDLHVKAVFINQGWEVIKIIHSKLRSSIYTSFISWESSSCYTRYGINLTGLSKFRRSSSDHPVPSTYRNINIFVSWFLYLQNLIICRLPGHHV